MSHWDFSRRPDTEHDEPYQPEPAGDAYQPDLAPGADAAGSSDWWTPGASGEGPQLAGGRWAPGGALYGFQVTRPVAGDPQADPWTAGAAGRRPGARRSLRGGGRPWLVIATVAAGAALGVGIVLLANRSPAGRDGQPAGTRADSSAARAGGSASPSPATASAPLTLAQAKAVVARYTAVNNSANAKRSDALLATAETASSYAIDAGSYLFQQGTAPYPPFAPARATYYIPRDEPAAGPRWFAVQVANASTSDPKKVTFSEYLLFTQRSPGGRQDAAEPNLLSGVTAPRVAIGADGLATAVSADAASLAAAPGRLPADTAASLDGTGQRTVSVPGALADTGDKQFWQGKLPGGTVTDTHAPAPGAAGQEFALRTAGGGALVFYADAAQLTITAPPGATFQLKVPGFYSPGQALTRAGMTYLEQFAAYDPPAGGKSPSVVADYSGITGKD